MSTATKRKTKPTATPPSAPAPPPVATAFCDDCLTVFAQAEAELCPNCRNVFCPKCRPDHTH